MKSVGEPDAGNPHVRFVFPYQTPDQLLMRCQRELLVAAKLRRTDATRVAVKPEEAYDRTDAHTALLGSVRYGSPAMHRFDHAPDSAFSGNALALIKPHDRHLGERI